MTDAEIKRLMGHAPVARRGSRSDCIWTTKRRTGGGETGEPAEEASISLNGYANVRQAKQFVGLLTERGYCEFDKFLPDPLLGDEAYVESCASNVLFRVGRVVGDVTTFTNAVTQGSLADTRRTAKFTRKAVPRLRRHRCGPPVCP